MTNEAASKDDPIPSLQAHIAELMSREVTLSREILANLREEETALLAHNDFALQQTMSKRDIPLQELMSVREDRIESVKQLAFLIFQVQGDKQTMKKEGEEANENNFLDVSDEQNCEVLVLRDQLIALIEKMNLQNSSNLKLLIHHQEYAKALNEHLDAWGYSVALPQKPAFVERRKQAGLTLLNRE